MIPSASINEELTTSESTDTIETTKTYKISDNRIQGFIDGEEALQQAIDKMLNTERYEYPIYSFSYGINLDDLIGKDKIYVQFELTSRIKECLLQDDRIESVDNFDFNMTEDNMLCTFDVVSIYGETTITKEVNV